MAKARALRISIEDGMVGNEGVVGLESLKRREAGGGITFADCDFPLDPQKLLSRELLANAHGINQINKRRGAAVHDRHFAARQLDDEVVDTKPPQGRHQVLDGRHLGAALAQRRRKGRVADILYAGTHGGVSRVTAHKEDSRILPGRA